MKKKLLALVCAITCLIGLSACGTTEISEKVSAQIETATQVAINSIRIAEYKAEDILAEGYNKEELAALYASNLGVEASLGAFDGLLTTYRQMSEDMDGVVEVKYDAVESKVEGKEIVVTIPVDGNKCDGQVVIKFSNDIFTRFHEGDAQANTSFAMKMDAAGKNMGKAGLNTLLGMGTVFVMLILICFIISAFVLFQKKPKAAPQVATSVATPEVVEEELVDDTELVAVIMAAIRAYEGEGSTDGFVVRSIKKANRRM